MPTKRTVIIDTNILISATFNNKSLAWACVQETLKNHILLFSEDTFGELEDVLHLPTEDQIQIDRIVTPTGKKAKDFLIPKYFEKVMIDLILRSEGLADGLEEIGTDKAENSKQYWFNVSEVMNNEQMTKLKDILMRERLTLANITAKYTKPSASKNTQRAKAKETTQRSIATLAPASKKKPKLTEQERRIQGKENHPFIQRYGYYWQSSHKILFQHLMPEVLNQKTKVAYLKLP